MLLSKCASPQFTGYWVDKELKRCANNEAYFGQGTKLTVLEPGLNITEPTVTVLRPSPKECKYRSPKDKRQGKERDEREEKKTIVCVASGFYPDHVGVTWKIDGDEIVVKDLYKDETTSVATGSVALQEDKYYNITSRLRVPAKDWFTFEKKFTCTVSFFNGTHTEHYSDSIYGVKDKAREKYLRITQTAKFSYGVFIIKSSAYGAFVAFLVWRLQRSARKHND
ncbi:hypothetical protein VZT92_009046 [Zoarces viviparus]|uniref:Ig-like domain-containing protein n=1 Tax=Zoarces viviparus TaxID=48416 RepID=A0AAW1FK24_ZOAVI